MVGVGRVWVGGFVRRFVGVSFWIRLVEFIAGGLFLFYSSFFWGK